MNSGRENGDAHEIMHLLFSTHEIICAHFFSREVEMEPDKATPGADEFQFSTIEMTTQKAICPVWRRFLAFFIDCMILGVVGYLLGLLFFDAFAGLGAWGRLVGFTVALLYFGPLDSVMGGGRTPGKMLCRIKVADRDGKPISLVKSVVRYLVIALPFFLNGLPLSSDALQSPAGLIVGLIVFGLGGAVIYLLIFNRHTRQSLHDLAVGSYVIKVGSPGPVSVPGVWKGHFVVIGVWLTTVAILLVVIIPRLGRSEVFAEMGKLQRQVERLDMVRFASVKVGETRWEQGKSRFLQVNAVLFKPCAEFEELTDRLAATIFEVYPKAAELDQVMVALAYGYDIGIASSWQQRQTGHAPGDWKTKLENSPMTAQANSADKVSTTSKGKLVCYKDERERFQAEIRELLYREEFARLEQMAEELRRERPRFSSGMPKLNDFYKALGGEENGSFKPDMDRHKRLLGNWRAFRPYSITPRIAMILLYERSAWKARGSGWAKDVPKKGWEGFKRDLESAHDLLIETERLRIDDPVLYALAIVVSQGLELSREETLGYLEKGVKIDPAFDPLYIYMANYLLPRWHGSPKEFHDFALHAAELAGPGLGDIMYVRVATVAQQVDGDNFRSQYAFSWPRLKRGLDELDRRFPNSSRTINVYGWFACRYRDAEAAREIMPRLSWGSDRDTDEIWKQKNTFDACKQWLGSETSQK